MKNWLVFLIFIVFSQASVMAKDKVIYIHKDGVGKITRTTKPQIDVLKKIYPQFTYKKGHWVWEADEIPAIYIYDGPTLAMTILIGEKKDIATIIVTSSKIKNSLGPNLNDKYKDVTKNKAYDCAHGIERDYRKIMCADMVNKSIVYAFAGKSYEGNYEKMPEIEVLNKLKISEIAWLGWKEEEEKAILTNDSIMPDL